MIILGINAYHPDASVAMIHDGALIWAAEEERYSRVKHASGFPEQALRNCLAETGVKPGQIDCVAVSKNPKAHILRKIWFALRSKPDTKLITNRIRAFARLASIQDDVMKALRSDSVVRPKFINVEHHLAHAASSYFMSGYRHSAFLSLDGLGDFSSTMWGKAEENQLSVLNRIYFPHSAGFLYTAATQFLGFLNFGDEYKVMGLAAYGEPVYLPAFKKMYILKKNGVFELNLSYFLHQRGQAKVRWEGGEPTQDGLYSNKWIDVFGKPRQPGAPLEKREKDIAASLQLALEDIYFHILNHLHTVTTEINLCLAGGVAFNSLANGKISRQTPFRNIYIQPAAGDAGTAIGAAAYVAFSRSNNTQRHFVMDHAYWSDEVNDEEIQNVLQEKSVNYQKFDEQTLLDKTALALSHAKVVGWFQGKMEFGPRALGNRSILANPTRTDMKDIINMRIKHREMFRPFAPAVLEEKADDYFEMESAPSPFMLKVVAVRPEKTSVLPAITHVDGTARVQTVSRLSNPLFWKLIRAFEKITGIPVLLNTSFNEHEPIVRKPREALDCFLKTKMDILVMGHFYIERKEA